RIARPSWEPHMKVVHVISSPDLSRGGPVAVVLGMTPAQARAGIEVSVVSSFVEGERNDLSERLCGAGVELHSVGPCRGGYRRHRSLAATLRRVIEACDVVHIHGLYEQIQHDAARIARDLHKPYVFTAQGMLSTWSLARGA